MIFLLVMWFSTEKYRGHGILLEELVVALPLKAVWGKVLRTNTAVLGGLKVFSPDSRFPFFTKAGSSQWKLVERHGLILVIPVLAAVSGTGLHHPSGLRPVASAAPEGGRSCSPCLCCGF